jgi:hypothetical protein
MSVSLWETGVEQASRGQLDTGIIQMMGRPHPYIVVEVIRVMNKRDEWWKKVESLVNRTHHDVLFLHSKYTTRSMTM